MSTDNGRLRRATRGRKPQRDREVVRVSLFRSLAAGTELSAEEEAEWVIITTRQAGWLKSHAVKH